MNRTPCYERGDGGLIPSSGTNMGAVVGYGFALQAYCLEGFDSLGLHQNYYFSSTKNLQVLVDQIFVECYNRNKLRNKVFLTKSFQSEGNCKNNLTSIAHCVILETS